MKIQHRDTERHVLTITVDNEAGILAKIAGLFTARGYNIDSLTVADISEDHATSRITIVTNGPPPVIDQIIAQLGNPDSLVIDIAGEASIQMNIQEMGTASQFRLPIKVFILNNEYMGMVRQWQELTYESRYSNSYSDSLPDFVKMAEAYGWKGIRIEQEADLDAGIRAMMEHDGPVMVDCMVSKEANCFPMIPSGAAHTEMLLYGDMVAGTMDDEAKALV